MNKKETALKRMQLNFVRERIPNEKPEIETAQRPGLPLWGGQKQQPEK